MNTTYCVDTTGSEIDASYSKPDDSGIDTSITGMYVRMFFLSPISMIPQGWLAYDAELTHYINNRQSSGCYGCI